MNSVPVFQTMAELVAYLFKEGNIKSERVAETMRLVDRKYFKPEPRYMDHPEPISELATISAPHMHAYALETVYSVIRHKESFAECKILDIGSGSGYLCAAFSALLNYQGLVVGIEHDSKLNEQARKNINKFNPLLLTSNAVKFVTGDGRLGWKDDGPYDVIHIGAACRDPPLNLATEQLKPGGALVAPVGHELKQQMVVYRKDSNGKITEEKTQLPVLYVPLTDWEEK